MKIGVLLYVNRSGSTLFSRLISDASSHVFVFPELGALQILLMAARARPIAGEELADVLTADPRIDAVGLPIEAIHRIARDHSSADLPALLAALAGEAQGQPPQAILVKLESLAYLSDEIDLTLPGATLFHIVRDPRAVVASMLRTPVPEKPGFDMARGSVVYAARHWSRYQHIVAAIATRRAVVEIRYEDLVARPAQAIARVLLAWDVAPTPGVGRGRYRVAAIDARLHGLIAGAADPARNKGWRDSLRPWQVRAVEAICQAPMLARSYAPLSPLASPWSFVMVRARACHLVATMRHAGGTAISYAGRRDRVAALRMRLHLALAARRKRGA